MERLHELETEWLEVEPSTGIRNEACRLLFAHPLRAADALQLAAVINLSREIGDRVPMICFDDRLVEAARFEQLAVVPHAKDVD